jgi:hypothetical protein
MGLLKLIPLIFVLNIHAQDIVINLSESDVQEDLGLFKESSAQDDCEFIYKLLPLNLVTGLRDFENINKSILPSNREFMAFRLTSLDENNYQVQSGLFKYQLEDEGLFLTSQKDKNQKSIVLLDQGKQLPDEKYIHRYFLTSPLPDEQNVDPTLNIPFKGDNKKLADFDLLAWEVGNKTIKLDGGIIDSQTFSIVEKEIDRQLLELDIEAYEAGHNRPEYQKRSILLRDAKRLISAPSIGAIFDKDKKKGGSIPYITITITFP